MNRELKLPSTRSHKLILTSDKNGDRMANVIPFKGVLYDQSVVGNIADVVAPPYDVIDAEMQLALHQRHPYNIVRLELGLDQPDDDSAHNRYTRAAAWLREWLGAGLLHRDPLPAVYPYTIEYRLPTGEVRTLKGFLSTIELEEFGTGRIFPHENTRAAAKADRLKLLEACQANFSPIFSLFSDAEGRVLGLLEKSVNLDQPRIDFRDDTGFRHRLWSITDQTVLEELRAAMKPKPLFIADGHHRYETALAYRRLRRKQEGRPVIGSPADLHAYDTVLMLFSSLEDPGLTVLPTHRILWSPLVGPDDMTRRLGESFDIHTFPFDDQSEPEARKQFLQALRLRGKAERVFGVALKDVLSYFLLALKPSAPLPIGTSPQDQLDVSILHAHILARLAQSSFEGQAIDYTKDEHKALRLVRTGNAHAAVLLNPTKVSEVRAVAASGGRMPHKSTYFFPKPLTGLVIHVFEE